jgi:hypothetical protein
MKVAYFIFVGNIIPGEHFFENCLRSLREVSDCEIIIYTVGDSLDFLIEKYNVKIIKISDDRWYKRRMCCKVECAKEIVDTLPNDTKFLVLDSDLVFLKDPFSMFEIRSEKLNELYITRRNVNGEIPINAGVWGLFINDNARNFLNTYISNIHKPEWTPLTAFKKSQGRKNDLDWWCDQDFLCAMHHSMNEKHKTIRLPITIKVLDPIYNFICVVDKEGTIVNKVPEDAVILHYKSGGFSGSKRWDSKTKNVGPASLPKMGETVIDVKNKEHWKKNILVWNHRNIWVQKYIKEFNIKNVVDIGCGLQEIAKLCKDDLETYIGYDFVQHTPEVRYINFNDVSSIEKSECYLGLGILEYVPDVDSFFRQISGKYKYFIFSFFCAGPDSYPIQERIQKKWINHFTLKDIMDIAAKYNIEIVRHDNIKKTEYLFCGKAL